MRNVVLAFVIVLLACPPGFCAAGDVPAASPPRVNTIQVPGQILKTGVTLNTTTLSPNSLQLANTIGLTPVLERIQMLRANPADRRVETRLDLYETIQKAMLIIQRTDLEVDFMLAEIAAENENYQEVLSTFTEDRDTTLARINAASFISNGALWAVCESLAIPTFKRPKFGISSGIMGIIAGVVPSFFSMYTLRAVNGKQKTSEVDPNMLAKLFNYPVTSETDYPDSIWQYLNQTPANATDGKKRVDTIIDHWLADANLPIFTDRHSKKQVDILTAAASHRKGLSIDTLSARRSMLEGLGAEVLKIKRMLLELTMAVQGDKYLAPAGTP